MPESGLAAAPASLGGRKVRPGGPPLGIQSGAAQEGSERGGGETGPLALQPPPPLPAAHHFGRTRTAARRPVSPRRAAAAGRDLWHRLCLRPRRHYCGRFRAAPFGRLFPRPAQPAKLPWTGPAPPARRLPPQHSRHDPPRRPRGNRRRPALRSVCLQLQRRRVLPLRLGRPGENAPSRSPRRASHPHGTCSRGEKLPVISPIRGGNPEGGTLDGRGEGTL